MKSYLVLSLNKDRSLLKKEVSVFEKKIGDRMLIDNKLYLVEAVFKEEAERDRFYLQMLFNNRKTKIN